MKKKRPLATWQSNKVRSSDFTRAQYSILSFIIDMRDEGLLTDLNAQILCWVKQLNSLTFHLALIESEYLRIHCDNSVKILFIAQ